MADGKEHHYAIEVRWTGNLGEGTKSYKSYARTHDIISGRKPAISGSSDSAFRGDADRCNPEDLMVGAVSACHKLWYLHLCAVPASMSSPMSIMRKA
jgi:organic hydroperoxide reductase OsmC/OhrA